MVFDHGHTGGFAAGDVSPVDLGWSDPQFDVMRQGSGIRGTAVLLRFHGKMVFELLPAEIAVFINCSSPSQLPGIDLRDFFQIFTDNLINRLE